MDDRSQCLESSGGGVLPASEVTRVAIATGAYEVSRLPDTVIAGNDAHCFLVRATGHGILPDLGVETRTCLAGDGVALWARTQPGETSNNSTTRLRQNKRVTPFARQAKA